MRLIDLCEAKIIISDVTVMTDRQINNYINDTYRVNKDVYDRLKYFHPGNVFQEETHFVVTANKKIVGVGGVQVNPYNKEQLWLKHVSVDPKFEGKGIARKIIESIYKWATEHNLKVAPSTYSQKGASTIKSTIDRMGAQYPNNHVENPNQNYFEGRVDELQAPLSHYRNVLRNKWDVPEKLQSYLSDNGYTQLGKGNFSEVWAKPGERFVLKIMLNDTSDDCYIDFIQALQHANNPHFPKIGRLRHFKLQHEEFGNLDWNIIPIERLEKLSTKAIRKRGDAQLVLAYCQMKRGDNTRYRWFKNPQEIYDQHIEDYPELGEALKFLDRHIARTCRIDLHEDNMMLRGNTLVITDPASYKW